jgi:uncharacterized protein (DUF427 family)
MHVEGTRELLHVVAGDQANVNAAWTYRHPYPWLRKIRNHVAFWRGVELQP